MSTQTELKRFQMDNLHKCMPGRLFRTTNKRHMEHIFSFELSVRRNGISINVIPTCFHPKKHIEKTGEKKYD